MYVTGEEIRMTEDFIFPVNPFMLAKIEKGKELTVTGVNKIHGYYKVSGLDSPILGLNSEEIVRKVPLRIKEVSEKVELKTKLSAAVVSKTVVNSSATGSGSTVNNQYTEILYHDLTFGNAMLHLELGFKVTRAIWGGYWKSQQIYTDGDLGARYKKAIVAHLKDGGWAVATPYQEDMLANDWMVVK